MKNYFILAAIFFVAFLQFQVGVHRIDWGYASSFALPFALILIKYGLNFSKKLVKTDKDGNLELDPIFVLILLSFTLNVACYHLGLNTVYIK